MVSDIVREFWEVLGTMAPYVLFGFLVAGVLSVIISPKVVEKHLGGRGPLAVLKASLLGVPLPLCSCGVIPVSASLARHGASPGATTAFLTATPQTGVDSIFVTYSLLGGVFAILRPLMALISGVIAGVAVSLFGGRGESAPPDRDPYEEPRRGATHEGKFVAMLRYGFVTLPGDIGRSLLIGLVAATLITALLPQDAFGNVVGTGLGGMLVMLALGVPVYVCATASVPLAAAMIVDQGVSPGAALVFLMTGPATNLATIGTVWKVMGRRPAMIYLVAVMGTALACGVALDATFSAVGVSPGRGHLHEVLPIVSHVRDIAAIGLLAILIPSVLRPVLRRRRIAPAEGPGAIDTSGAVTLTIKGMTCSHCASAVRRTLEECPGVDSAAVDLARGRAAVTGTDLDGSDLVKAVTELGYAAQADEGDEGRHGGT